MNLEEELGKLEYERAKLIGRLEGMDIQIKIIRKMLKEDKQK